MPPLTLYHYWRSSSSWRVRWMLAHKKLQAKLVDVNLLQGQQQEEPYRALSPTGFVPALQVGERTLTESVAIATYLEAAHPEQPWLPTDPWLRARTMQLVEIVNAGTQPLQNLLVLRTLYPEESGRKRWSQQVIERGLAAFERVLRELESEGVRGPYCLGEESSLADMFLCPQLYNARRFEVALDSFRAQWSTRLMRSQRPQGKLRTRSGSSLLRSELLRGLRCPVLGSSDHGRPRARLRVACGELDGDLLQERACAGGRE